MHSLFGNPLSALGLREWGMHGTDHIGVQLLQVVDGAAQGMRVLDLHAGPRLSLRIAVDRGFDPYLARTRGIPIGWTSATGLRPFTQGIEDDGYGLLRAFSGLLVTCGLDWFGAPGTTSAEAYGYAGRAHIKHPLHGRFGMSNAEIIGSGVDWAAAVPVVFAEARVAQSMVFGEHLVLQRRVELEVGGSIIRIWDRVTNLGFRATPHQLLYHWNFGAPLLSADSVLELPSIRAGCCAAPLGADRTDWKTMAPPLAGVSERVFEHFLTPDVDGLVHCSLAQPAVGLKVELEYDSRVLPAFYQWQAFERGIYAVGLEPATHSFENIGSVPLLPDETREYRLSLKVFS